MSSWTTTKQSVGVGGRSEGREVEMTTKTVRIRDELCARKTCWIESRRGNKMRSAHIPAPARITEQTTCKSQPAVVSVPRRLGCGSGLQRPAAVPVVRISH
jgi:hypothetical protein